MVAAKRARRGRPPLGLERVKFFVRVDPVDAETFRRARVALVEAERRRVTDAEVFRRAVAALVAGLPAELRARARLEGGSKFPVRRRVRSV